MVTYTRLDILKARRVSLQHKRALQRAVADAWSPGTKEHITAQTWVSTYDRQLDMLEQDIRHLQEAEQQWQSTSST